MARISCQGCGKPITGQYIKAMGSAWHAECFCCAHCGKPIMTREFLEKKGKPYHTSCFHERFSPRCHACKEPIEDEYLRAMGKIWHPEHFVCAHCSQVIQGNYFARLGKPYCIDDYILLFREKCAVCGDPLEDRFLVDVWGNKYCQKHEHAPHCTSCDRFIGMKDTGDEVRYADGRIVCKACSQDAVVEVSDAYTWMRKVQKVLSKYDFQFDPKVKIPVRLVGFDAMQSTLSNRKRTRKTAGVTQTNIETLFGVESGREVKGIQVLYGLPPEHLGGVLAHELGHVWLFMNRYPKLPKNLEEGVCELMAWYWLQSQESDRAKVRLKLLEKNRDRVYGAGFRKVRKAVEQFSLPYILDHLKRYASLPK